MIHTAFCPFCGAEAVPLAGGLRGSLSDPIRAIVGPCAECGADLTILRARAREDPEWQNTQRLAMPSISDARELGILIGAAGAGLVIAILAVSWLGMTYAQGFRVFIAWQGIVFLLASLGWPWWLYEAYRRQGWFAQIESTTAMKVILCVFGVAFLTVSVLVRLE